MPRLSDRLKRRRSRASAGIESLETRTLLAAAPVLSDVGGTRSFTEGGPPVPVDADLTITSPDVGATLDGASVTIGGGFAAGEDVLSFTAVAGITGAYNAGSGVLTFTGIAPIEDYQAVLRSVAYANTDPTPSLPPRTVSITLSAGPLFNPVTGHFYDFIDTRLDGSDAFGISWQQAEAEAESAERKLFGLQGYLATITSAQENDFAASKLEETGWIGGSDAAVEGEWRWVTGPEGLEPGGGLQFWAGTAPSPPGPFPGGGPVNGEYSNWNSTTVGGTDDEPNDLGGEDYAHMLFDPTIGPRGTWNDLANFGPFVPYIPFGYLIEYGGMPGDPELQLAGSVTININQGPTITSFESSSPDCGGAAVGETVTVSGAFVDAGVTDTHTATIDWGDGTITPGSVAETGGAGTVAGSHVYAAGGIYTITLTVTDNGGGTDTRTALAYVSGVGVVDGQLQIIGTDDDDHVTVNQQGNGDYKVHADFLGSGNFVVVPGAGVTSILAILCHGDDHFNAAGSIDTPITVDGGEGNDHLNGSNGGGILIGGPGNDHLNGGSGRDLLIGGDGADRIVGNQGDDVLVAGTTAFDANYNALEAVRAGVVTLDDTNAFDDGLVDVLTGSAGFDRFLFNKTGGVLDKVSDRPEVEVDID